MFRETINDKNRSSNLNELEVYNCDFLNVRAGYSTRYKILGRLAVNRIVEVHSTKNNWARIKYNGGYGWCSLSYLRKVVHSTHTNTVKVYKVKEAINLRSSASWSGDILKVVPKDTLLDVIEISGDWAKVWYANKEMYAPVGYIEYTGTDKNGTGTTPPNPDSGDKLPNLTEQKEPIRPIIQYKNKYWIDIYNPDMSDFRFNTSELNMHMITKPTEIITMLKYEKVDNLNFDGDLISSNDTFDTTEIELEFYIRRENYNYIINQIKKMVRMQEFRLTFGWDRRFFRYARISDNIEVEEFDFDDIEAKIIMYLEVQPYRYTQDSVYWLKDTKGNELLKHGSYIVNNYEKSYPKLYIQIPHTSYCRVNGSTGKKQVIINLKNIEKNISYEYKINAHSYTYNGKAIKYIYGVLDSTTGNLYEDTTDANLNHLLDIESDFPIILPGRTLISQSGNYVNIATEEFLPFKIIPNWREL